MTPWACYHVPLGSPRTIHPRPHALLLPCQVHVMVRQMLGAVNQFVAAHAKEILAHGRATSLQAVAEDPNGRRSYEGKPKLGGPDQLLENDPRLTKTMQTYAEMPTDKRPSYNTIAKNLRKANKKWCVQKGDNRGRAWAPKQIMFFLKRFHTSSGTTSKTRPTPRAKKSHPGEKTGAKPTRTTLPIMVCTSSGAKASRSAKAKAKAGKSAKAKASRSSSADARRSMGSKAARLVSTPRPLPTKADQDARPRTRTRASST